MLPGDNIIYKCPNCGKKVYNPSLISGNNLGAELYSDGKQIAPMLPEFPTVTQCPDCGTLFRLTEPNQIGVSEPWEEIDDDIAEAKQLSIKGNLKAIEQEFFDDNTGEVEFRINIWHLFNDRVRKGKPLFKNDADKKVWEDNLHKLLDLLDRDVTNEMIMAAEVYRNLGKFDECMSLITKIANPNMNWLTEKFKIGCEKQNTLVFKLY
jgi:DNA-directed RNA polymerase subunit RPC12/RpoP